MGLITDLIAGDLGDADPAEIREHIRAIDSLTGRQLSGMLGWLQQEQDSAYGTVHLLLDARRNQGTEEDPWAPVPGAGRAQAAGWFHREMSFAIDAHEFTSDVEAGVAAIFGGAPEAGRTAGQYAKAAQLIACTRMTCGGPNAGHEHITSPAAPRRLCDVTCGETCTKCERSSPW